MIHVSKESGPRSTWQLPIQLKDETNNATAIAEKKTETGALKTWS